MKILADASLPNLQAWFQEPFILTTYSNTKELKGVIHSQDILLCRSTLKVTKEILADTAIRYVATASSGTDHIDSNFLQQHGISLVDAKGCNARSVADYIITVLAWLEQHQLIKGRTTGVIGGGKVGSRVISRLQALGYSTVCYDPYLSQTNATYPMCSFAELYACDVLLVHANLHSDPPYPSNNLLNGEFLAQLKPGTVIINAARGGVVNEAEVLNHPHLIYCTDVYLNEPNLDKRIVDFATLCTPHIAGHSIDAKLEAVRLVSEKLHQHYKLPMPLQTVVFEPESVLNKTTWQEFALSLYNPYQETLALKSAANKEQAFLSLRKAHQTRRDFIHYHVKNPSVLLRKILGIE